MSYTPKEFFSPSSISLGRRCKRRWAFRYIDGIREPELPYEYFTDSANAEEVKSLPEGLRMQWYSMRSKALGTAVHAVLEHYYGIEIINRALPDLNTPPESPAWNTIPGAIARAMADHLPHPEACEEIEVEQEIELGTSFYTYAKGVDPIQLSGKLDLLVKVDGYWGLKDFKSSKSLINAFEELGYNYVKTPEELREDEQAALYSLYAMQHKGLNTIDCEWVYSRTKGKPDATSTKFVMGLGRTHSLVSILISDAIGLREIMRSGLAAMDLPGNPEACGDFGRTCEHHVSNGGPCAVRQSLGTQLVNIKNKEIKKMGFKEDLAKAKAEAAAKPKAGAKPVGKPKAPPPEEAEEETEVEEEEKPAAKAKPKAAGAKATAKPKAEPEAPAVERSETHAIRVAHEGVLIVVSSTSSDVDAETIGAITDKIIETVFG